jgi:hypothetical protein
VQKARLKLLAKKAILISDTVTFFRRAISRDGVKYAPKSFQALLAMPEPANASKLHLYVGPTVWMRSRIPADAEVIAEVGSSRKAAVKCPCRHVGVRNTSRRLRRCSSS